MADIHANGRMSAKITVGTVQVYSDGIDPDLVYTKEEVDEKIENIELTPGPKGDKGDKGEDGYTPIKGVDYFDGEQGPIGPEGPQGIQGEKGEPGENGKDGEQGPKGEKGDKGDTGEPGTTDYNQLENKPDLTGYATKEELNEVKQSVSNGKELLASAITDKGVNTSKDDTFQTMANNVSQITTGDGPVYENPDFYEIRTSGGTNMKGLFYYYGGKNLDLSNFNTSIVTDMSYMFHYCSKLTSLDLSNFNTSIVTDMSYMFYYCQKLTSLDLSNFNTNSVTNMGGMFYYCDKLTSLDLSSFDTSNVTIMSNMFYGCSSLTSLNLSTWNTSNVTDMSYMFYYCQKLTSLDLSNFDTSNVTSMYSMFQGEYGGKCIERLIIPNWDMTKVTLDIYTKIFGTSASCTTKLKYIDISNTDSGTLTKVKDALYAKTADAPGEIVVPANTSQELIEALQAKYWNPVFPTE